MTQRRGIASRGKTAAIQNNERQQLTKKLIEGLLDDLQSKRIPLPILRLSDDVQPGLRIAIRDSGLVSWHTQYELPAGKDGQRTRPYIKIGDYPEMTIDRARNLTKTILALAEKGIDPMEGLHDRLIRELEEKGTRWRP